MTPENNITRHKVRSIICSIAPSMGKWLATASVMGALGLCRPALAEPAPDGHAYRCHDGHGQVTYSQQPCADTAQLLPVVDARTPGQAFDARANLERDMKLARQAERQRKHRERESASVPARALLVRAEPHAKAASQAAARSTVDDDAHRLKRRRHFTALVPKDAKGSGAAAAVGAN
jgi:hypothetical protein